ncbi:hypothetical protein [Flavonifractor porci]|uniref:hypothetical protein n=1 Tax=Flavonifractor porci TaxID=3133422 RepID=UPI0030AF15D1
MFCPFINGECREDCTFRHLARASTGGMISNTSLCALAIAADQLDQYILMRIMEAEDQNS